MLPIVVLNLSLRHARNCVFWPGVICQITSMCKACCLTCEQHAQQHPREPLQPFSQDLFKFNDLAYLVTVDHYSDVNEMHRLPTIQVFAVIHGTKKHFGFYGVPHTLITDNGAQFTSELFKCFASQYKFQHITSSPYWSQANGCTEAAVKTAKHILLTADDVELALGTFYPAQHPVFTAPAEYAFSPAQHLFGRQLRTNLPQPASTLTASTSQPDILIKNQMGWRMQQERKYDRRAGQPLPNLAPQTNVYAKPSLTSPAKAWIPG